MLTWISLIAPLSDQLFAWSDGYSERTRQRTAKTPQRSCAPTAAAEIDPAGLPHRAIQALWQAGMQVRRRSRTRAEVLSVRELSWSTAANGLRATGCLRANCGVSRQLSPKPGDSGSNLRDQPRVVAPSRGALNRCHERAAGCRPRPDRCGSGRRASGQYAGWLARRQRRRFAFCGGGR